MATAVDCICNATAVSSEYKKRAKILSSTLNGIQRQVRVFACILPEVAFQAEFQLLGT